MTLSLRMKLATLSLVAGVGACATVQQDQIESTAQEMSSSWFATNLPAGSADAAAVLALMNDTSMSHAEYVNKCRFSDAQAGAIIAYRQGDEPAAPGDDEVFNDLTELDRIPYTDSTFWWAAIACAKGTPAGPAAVPTVIEFIVDESGSMDGISPAKWGPARDALLAAFEDMRLANDWATFVGALRFSTAVGEKVAPASLVDPNHYGDLVDLIDTPKAGGGATGTEMALKAGYAVVERFNPPASSGLTSANLKRAVVILSDGKPSNGTTEQAACQDLAASKFAAPDASVLTFSVGIGAFAGDSSYDPKFMGRLAQSGGTAPAGCDAASVDPAAACHFQITPGADITATKEALVAAINAIRVRVQSSP